MKGCIVMQLFRLSHRKFLCSLSSALVSFNAWSFSLRPILLSLWVFWAWTKPLPFKVQNSVVVRGNKCYRAGKIPRKFLTPTWPIFPFEQQKSHSLDKISSYSFDNIIIIIFAPSSLLVQLCVHFSNHNDFSQRTQSCSHFSHENILPRRSCSSLRLSCRL